MLRLARRIVRFIAGLLLLAGVMFASAFVMVLLTSQVDERQPSDAIVVLGAAQYNGKPSPVFQARLDHALLLYRDKLAPRVVVTGGQASGDHESEAAVGKRYLASRGIPTSALVVEPAGRSTAASMSAVAGWVKEKELSTVILVSDPFHMARLRAEARRTGLTARLSPTTTSPISNNKALEMQYLLAEAWKVPIAWIRSLSFGWNLRDPNP